MFVEEYRSTETYGKVIAPISGYLMAYLVDSPFNYPYWFTRSGVSCGKNSFSYTGYFYCMY